jgi:hypothetical protein
VSCGTEKTKRSVTVYVCAVGCGNSDGVMRGFLWLPMAFLGEDPFPAVIDTRHLNPLHLVVSPPLLSIQRSTFVRYRGLEIDELTPRSLIMMGKRSRTRERYPGILPKQ